MSSITNKKNQIVAPIAIAIVALFAIFTIYRQLDNPYVWYDESGQFLISQGQNHYAAPLSGRGSLSDVLRNNHDYNLDPGGYSVILYFWNLISTNTYFTRLLSVLFFIGALLCLWKIGMRTYKNVYYSLLLILPLLISSHVVKDIAYIRAYSMVMCGVCLALLLLLKYKNNFSYGNLFALGTIVALFCTSRYEYILFAFTLSLYVIFLIYRQSSSVIQFGTKAVVYGTLPLLAVLAIWYFQMRYQTSSFGISDYIGSISRNPKAFYCTMSLLLYIQILLIAFSLFKQRNIPTIAWISLGNALLVFMLAICNKFPWDADECISTYILLMISCIIIVIDLFDGRLSTFSLYILSFLCLMLVCTTTFISITDKSYNFRYSYYRNFKEYEKINIQKFSHIFIECYKTPDVIYMYEYGSYKSRQKTDKYPTRFCFQKGIPPTPAQGQKRDTNIIFNTIPKGCDLYWFNGGEPILCNFKSYHGSRYFFTEK